MKTTSGLKMDVLRTISADINITCFTDINKKKMKEIENGEKSLIPNVFVFCNFLIVNPTTSCTPRKIFFNCSTCKFKNLAEINNDQQTF